MTKHLDGSMQSKDHPQGLLKWIPLLLAVAFISLFLSLSAWQWNKASAKSSLASAPLHYFTALPDTLTQADQRFYRLKGQLLSQWALLLDNRTRNGQAGYELIVPFRASNQQILLLNLGWLKAPPLRADLPILELPHQQIQVQGQLVALPITPTLAEEPIEPSGWPRRIQSLNINRFSERSGLSAPTMLLQLDAPLTPALDTHWPPPRMTAERHLGYALQWLLLALTILIMALFYWRSIAKEASDAPH